MSDVDAYLRSHVWGLLATTRSSGAPQVTMVAYDWDGTDLVISCRATAAKFVNAARRPEVVFTVPDEGAVATLTGVARCLASGEELDRLTERVRDRLTDGEQWAADILDNDIAAGLDEVGRAIIVVEPSSVTLTDPIPR